jgi:hypothetical protein
LKPIDPERLRGVWSATPTPFTDRMRVDATAVNRVMRDVYGGKSIACWMSGLKHLLVEMGLFRTTRNFLGYPLTPACRRAMARALVRAKEVLFP